MMLQHYKHLKLNMVVLCDVVAKDSCFHFANTEIETTENERDNNEHFDFKLDANMNGRFSQSDFALAYFRDELKSAGLNPEINIQHQDNRSNPHHTQELDKIKKFWALMMKQV
jgi:hypothetical protein